MLKLSTVERSPTDVPACVDVGSTDGVVAAAVVAPTVDAVVTTAEDELVEDAVGMVLVVPAGQDRQ